MNGQRSLAGLLVVASVWGCSAEDVAGRQTTKEGTGGNNSGGAGGTDRSNEEAGGSAY